MYFILKKGTLYIQRLKDTSLVTIDSIKIEGDSKFETNKEENNVKNKNKNYEKNFVIKNPLFFKISKNVLN